ncbi:MULTISPECIES: EthD family reductase [unclassified Chryseobacterium]|uniref:EthD family reductase n=1 Tax=unclassified Chryseobacterium TaxID=2593645 RepID=UPI00226AD1D9|nr:MULTISPECIES: EthD family reductase [unclassified Chryseobacterium]
MFKITIFYPVKHNDWFDMEYYTEKHLALSKSVFGNYLKGIGIEKSESSDSVYKVIGHLFFEEIEHFYNCFLPNKTILEEDAVHYTNVKAVIQISKVIVWQNFT